MLQVNEGKFLNIYSNKNKNYDMFEKIKSLEENFFKKFYDKSFKIKNNPFQRSQTKQILFCGIRYEIESGILDEDGETDLELFLDNKDIKALGNLFKEESQGLICFLLFNNPCFNILRLIKYNKDFSQFLKTFLF